MTQSCADEGKVSDNKISAPEDCGEHRWTCTGTSVCVCVCLVHRLKKKEKRGECLNVSLVCVYLIIIFCVSSTRVCFCRRPVGEIIINCSLAATHFSYLRHHQDKLPNDAGINSLPGIAQSQTQGRRLFPITGTNHWSKNTSSGLWWGFFFSSTSSLIHQMLRKGPLHSNEALYFTIFNPHRWNCATDNLINS